VARAIKEAKAGRVEFRLDKTANIHVVIGKASFDATKLYEKLRGAYGCHQQGASCGRQRFIYQAHCG